jgi:hypothetical protein
MTTTDAMTLETVQHLVRRLRESVSNDGNDGQLLADAADALESTAVMMNRIWDLELALRQTNWQLKLHSDAMSL